MKYLRLILFAGLFASMLWLAQGLASSLASGGSSLRIKVIAINQDTGKSIRDGQHIPPGTPFVVSVQTNGVDCAGQFVVTALGDEAALPAVLVDSATFIIGPAAASDTASGSTLDSTNENTWKVSATCNGARRGQIATDSLEFFVGDTHGGRDDRGHKENDDRLIRERWNVDR